MSLTRMLRLRSKASLLEGGGALLVSVSESSNCPKDAEGTAVSESSSFTDADSNAALQIQQSDGGSMPSESSVLAFLPFERSELYSAQKNTTP